MKKIEFFSLASPRQAVSQGPGRAFPSKSDLHAGLDSGFRRNDKKISVSFFCLPLLSFAFCFFPFLSYADETAAFLNIGVGARAVGMGNAFTAVSGDVNSLFWNPAGLADLKQSQLGAMDAPLAAGTNFNSLGYATPTKYGTFGASALYLSQGALDGRNTSAQPTGGFDASDFAGSLAYASKIGKSLSLGANLKYIHSAIASDAGEDFALDAGALYELGKLGPGTPSLGLMVQNLGPKMSLGGGQASYLPTTLAAGISYLWGGFLADIDYKSMPYAPASEVDAGLEFRPINLIALRAGYDRSTFSEPLLLNGSGGIDVAALNGFSFGTGLRLDGFDFDYSFTPQGELGDAQRFSLTARF